MTVNKTDRRSVLKKSAATAAAVSGGLLATGNVSAASVTEFVVEGEGEFNLIVHADDLYHNYPDAFHDVRSKLNGTLYTIDGVAIPSEPAAFSAKNFDRMQSALDDGVEVTEI